MSETDAVSLNTLLVLFAFAFCTYHKNVLNAKELHAESTKNAKQIYA